MSKILIDKAVVEQALDVLKDIWEGGLESTSENVHGEAIDALRAALEQHSSLTCKQDLQVPSGFVLLQTREGKPVYAACLDGGRFNGWLMWKHPDGQWVSKRKLENWEIMQAEDQRDSGIVQGD